MTDVALQVTKQHRELTDVIYVGDVAALATVRERAAGIEIGAAVSLTDALPALDRAWPELHEAWQRFASVPIRNGATLVGNVANGSPIGDAMPILLALDAIVVLRSAAGEREVALDAFYPVYRQTVREPGEFIAAVRIPRRPSDLALRAYEALRHRRLGLQEGASHLGGRQAPERSQGQRDLGVDRERRMAAREEQLEALVLERVVAHLVLVGLR